MLNRRFHMLMDKDMWNKITKTAKAENISYGEFIRRAISRYSDEQKMDKSKEAKTSFNRFFKIPKNR